MTALLPRIASPKDLHALTEAQLEQLAQEMRDELVRVCSIRPAHFASNLGVVELALALHLTFDFSQDRLIWDTGHQIYPHKMLTGPAGGSVSTISGLKAGDDLLGRAGRKAVAVIGDGALPCGMVFEAFNNIA